MKLLLISAAVLCVALGACERSNPWRASGPLPHDVYIWQRLWTSGVPAAITESRPIISSFVVLTAEITLGPGAPKVVRPKLDYRTLVKTGRPIGLAIRIDPYRGPFRSDDSATRSILKLVSERLAEARHHGLEPCELQIDFDCADSKLDGYRAWLSAIRKAVAPLPVRPTVLPSWLTRTEFANLARESGCFVLQVHSVAPPRTPEDVGKLTNPTRAKKWVEEAAKLRVPFRVALPTYTYLVAFDEKNQVRGISAEGPSARWPSDSRVLRWEADPTALAGLVADWSRDRPSSLMGVIWYRLPIAADSLNWRWVTLAKVMRGEMPRSDLHVKTTGESPSDVTLVNRGERDEALPEMISADWTGSRLVAADALGSYEIEPAKESPAERILFRRKPSAALSRLPPGARLTIGWIRCETPTQIRVSVGEAARASTPGDIRSPSAPADSRHGIR